MAKEKLAIDFDSAITNIYKLGSGLVLSEPTVAATNDDAKCEVKAIGIDANKLIGKTAKNTKIVFPVYEGEIVNERVATGLLRGFLNKIEAKTGVFSGATAVFAVPCGVTADIIEKFRNVAISCGIRKSYFVEAPVLSALGQRIPLTDSSPSFIIDMAGGTTNIAAVSLDGIITGVSVNFGYNKISTDIIDYVSDSYGLQIGLLTADRLRKEIASLEDGDMLSLTVNGRNVNSGKPMSAIVSAAKIAEPVKAYYDKISEIAIEVLKKLPPEVSAEIRRAGIYVSGGGSTVYGLEGYYADKFGMNVNIAEHGLMSVALGGGVLLGNSDLLKKLAVEC
ncbi:MAG: rod shape-determining protein [Clostridia bacterium]|nr:rod shape-determining protein [Clostridia bacterium]